MPEIWTIDKIRSFFVDPTGNRDTAKLALRASHVTSALGLIYSKDPRPQALEHIMAGMGDDELGMVIKDMIRRESKTRKFDHLFMGQIHPQGNEAAILAKLVAGFMNTNTIVKEVSTSEHEMEQEALDWTAELIGYDLNTYSGNITSGGSTANLDGLWVAREKAKKRLKNKKDDMIVISSKMGHYSIDKACNLLGDNVLIASVKTKDFVTDIDDVERILKTCKEKGKIVAAIVGLAGETETGMVDDLDRLADLAAEYGVHFHVDAAYGGPYKLINPSRFKGLERADSVVIDPHKLLYTSYPCGMILFKNMRDHSLIQNKARYLAPEEKGGVLAPKSERNFGLAARVEGSMGADGALMAWASIQLFGKEGYKVLLQHTMDLTQTAYDRIKDSKELKALHEPQTNTLLIGLKKSFGTPADDLAMMEKVKDAMEKKYGYYVSVNGEVDHKHPAFRTVYMHPYTTSSDVLDMLGKLEGEINNLKK